MPLCPGQTLGYYTCNTAYKAELTSSAEPNAKQFKKENGLPHGDVVKLHNLGNAGGYLPIVGILFGVNKIWCVRTGLYFGNELTTGARAFLAVRGTLECLGLGILFLIPDIIASIAHACRANKKTYKTF